MPQSPRAERRGRARVPVSALCAAVGLVAMTAGCADGNADGGVDNGAGGEVLQLNTYAAETGDYAEAQLIGSLEATVEGGTACFAVQGSDTRYFITWPEGYSALDDPLRVVDADGEVVAIEGDEVEVVGGESGQEADCGGERAPEWLAGPVFVTE